MLITSHTQSPLKMWQDYLDLRLTHCNAFAIQQETEKRGLNFYSHSPSRTRTQEHTFQAVQDCIVLTRIRQEL